MFYKSIRDSVGLNLGDEYDIGTGTGDVRSDDLERRENWQLNETTVQL